MTIINIVAGGPLERIPALFRDDQEIWIAVDGGLEHMLSMEIEPDDVIGDFDSSRLATEDVMRYKNVSIYPPEKDFTDLELALIKAIGYHPTLIQIYGATGGRLDHEMANLQMLFKSLKSGVDTAIIDVQNRIHLKNPGTYSINQNNYQYVSFLSVFEEVKGLTLKGFKYPLDRAALEFGSSLCISNESIVETSTYSFSSGILMVVESND